MAQIHGFYNNSGQHGIEPNFGLDEAAEFTREHDSELVYVYALARGDADDAADLIEYLNAEVGSNPNGGTAWAEVRAANGHEAPYNVRYFEIGNEMNQGGADGTTAQTYWIDDVPGGALTGYINGGTASFSGQYVVAKDDWNQTASYSDGTADQTFYLRYARVERDEKAEDYASFTAVNKGSVKIYAGGTQWTEVPDLETAGADAQVYSVDYKTGQCISETARTGQSLRAVSRSLPITVWIGTDLYRSLRRCAARWIRSMNITAGTGWQRKRSIFTPALRRKVSSTRCMKAGMMICTTD